MVTCKLLCCGVKTQCLRLGTCTDSTCTYTLPWSSPAEVEGTMDSHHLSQLKKAQRKAQPPVARVTISLTTQARSLSQLESCRCSVLWLLWQTAASRRRQLWAQTADTPQSPGQRSTTVQLHYLQRAALREGNVPFDPELAHGQTTRAVLTQALMAAIQPYLLVHAMVVPVITVRMCACAHMCVCACMHRPAPLCT